MSFMFGQVYLSVLLSFGLMAQEAPLFRFEAPSFRESIFKEGLGLLDRERDEYATTLASFAGNHVTENEASELSLALARRLLGLSFHLSSRNRRAVVLKHQLEKGIVPKKVETPYSAKAMAALFLTRAQVLIEQKGEKNMLLARALVEIAATVDPLNEDVVYAFEMQQIDLGPLNWECFTSLPAAKEQEPVRLE